MFAQKRLAFPGSAKKEFLYFAIFDSTFFNQKFSFCTIIIFAMAQFTDRHTDIATCRLNTNDLVL